MYKNSLLNCYVFNSVTEEYTLAYLIRDSERKCRKFSLECIQNLSYMHSKQYFQVPQ